METINFSVQDQPLATHSSENVRGFYRTLNKTGTVIVFIVQPSIEEVDESQAEQIMPDADLDHLKSALAELFDPALSILAVKVSV